MNHQDMQTLFSEAPVEELIRLTPQGASEKIDLCSIINARSGDCSEDCSFCAQSIHHSAEGDTYPFMEKQAILDKALAMDEAGVERFSLVTSGRSCTDELLDKVVPVVQSIKGKTGLKICASLGLLTAEQGQVLFRAGVERYHHNLETSREFFPEMCTTHTFEQRVSTVNNALSAGMSVCSGGIWGIGESFRDRLSLALVLRELDVDSVALNVLNPRKGTPAAGSTPLSFEEIFRSALMYRYLMPEKNIRFCGGRNLLDRNHQALLFRHAFDGAIVGNYLTVEGHELAEDLAFLAEQS